jgi:hypothetical protein
MLEAAKFAWEIIQKVATHRWSRLAAAAALILGAGWYLHRQPVAVVHEQTTTTTKEASYTMGRIGLRIRGGVTVLTLNADGLVVTIQNTGGELLMVQRASATRTVDAHVDVHKDDRLPPPPPPGGHFGSSGLGFRYGAGLAYGVRPDGRTGGVMASAGLWHLDGHMLLLYPTALLGAVEWRFR